MSDPRQLVVIGVGQHLERDGGLDPISLIGRAVESAAADTTLSPRTVLDRVDTIATANIVSWRYQDASRAVGEAIGRPDVTTLYPDVGGNAPQMLVNRLAERIAAGTTDVALLCGGEAYRTRMRAKRTDTFLAWDKQDKAVAPDWSGSRFEMAHPAELALGILLPTQCYPLFDNALRHRAGASEPDWRAHLGRLWAGFSAVAASNPHAWDRELHSAEEIATVTETNRLVGAPYTKRMVSNPDVDMASAVVVCSAERAEAWGVPTDRWVFLHAGADGKDPFLSERPDFTSSAAIRHAGGAALELAGVGIDDLAHLDVYSCFPSAVQIACRELGIGLDRTLTTYGGLSFGGGPWNNPVGHAIVTMVETLRADAGAWGLVTANGGNLQKHSFGVYSTRRPKGVAPTANPQFAIDTEPNVEVAADYVGPARIESWTVMHERDGSPARMHASLRTPDGARVWAVSNESALLEAARRDDLGEVDGTVIDGNQLRW